MVIIGPKLIKIKSSLFIDPDFHQNMDNKT
jgi:hypothetical protein